VGRNTVTKVGDGKSLDVFGTFERKTLFGTTRDEIDNCTPEDTKMSVARSVCYPAIGCHIAVMWMISSLARLQVRGV